MFLKRVIFVIIFVSLNGCANTEDGNLYTSSSDRSSEKEESKPFEDTKNSNNNAYIDTTVPPEEELLNKQGNTDVLSNLEASISHEKIGESNHFHFEIKNTSQHAFTFHFNTNQQFLYIIYNENGDVIEEQDNSIIKKMPSTYFVKPGGIATYEVSTKNLSKGKYKIIFTFLAKEKTIKKAIDFTVI